MDGEGTLVFLPRFHYGYPCCVTTTTTTTLGSIVEIIRYTFTGVACLLAGLLVYGILRSAFQAGRDWEAYTRLRKGALRQGRDDDATVPHWNKGAWER